MVIYTVKVAVTGTTCTMKKELPASSLLESEHTSNVILPFPRARETMVPMRCHVLITLFLSLCTLIKKNKKTQK